MPSSESGSQDSGQQTIDTSLRKVPEFELGEPNEYRYIPQEEVTKVLGEEFKYGSSKRFVDAIYIHEDGKRAVGVLQVTKEMCEGHFEGEGNALMRGVDQIEAMAQTLLLLEQFTERVPSGQSPRFLAVDSTRFLYAAVPGMVLNIAVMGSEEPMTGYARIFTGDKTVSEGRMTGALMSERLSTGLLARVRRNIPEPKFPLR